VPLSLNRLPLTSVFSVGAGSSSYRENRSPVTSNRMSPNERRRNLMEILQEVIELVDDEDFLDFEDDLDGDISKAEQPSRQ
jgi:hypothetical protein